jgi:hypothetical protein
MGTLGWIISLGSGASLAGYIALLFFAPQAALVIERITLDLLARIVSTRLGVALLVGTLAFVAGDFYGDHHGAARVQAEWDAAEHAAIEEGRHAREEAEREIAPVASDDTSAAAPPAASAEHFRLPDVLNRRPPDACPPAPKCAAPRGRNPDPRLRHDPHNRDHH